MIFIADSRGKEEREIMNKNQVHRPQVFALKTKNVRLVKRHLQLFLACFSFTKHSKDKFRY